MADKRIVVWVQHFTDRANLVLQWTDPVSGKRRSKSTGTADPKEAERQRADHEFKVNHGLHRDAGKVPWDDFREAFEQEYVARLRPNTRRNHADTLNLFERLCEPRRLDLVTARTLSAFHAAMCREELTGGRKGMQPGTVKMRLRFLRTALRWAVGQGLLGTCPKFPAVRVPQKKPRPVPTESFEKLLDKAPDAQTRAYLLCGWCAGLRLAEAFDLEREPTEKAPWLDFAADRIWVPGEYGKAERDAWVPLDPVLRAALEALPAEGRNVFHFLAPDGHPVTAHTMSDRVIQLARKAGVKLTMHTLRKGFACRYAAKVPPQVLALLMRHGDIKMTMTYYACIDDAAEEAVLGPKRNRSRNTPAQTAPAHDAAMHASPEVERGTGG